MHKTAEIPNAEIFPQSSCLPGEQFKHDKVAVADIFTPSDVGGGKAAARLAGGEGGLDGQDRQVGQENQ